MLVLTNQSDIREWATSHSMTPQFIAVEDARGDSVGLRFDFPGKADETYAVENDHHKRDVEWHDFFQKFEEQGLALEVYDDEPGVRSPEQLYRFIHREQLQSEGQRSPLF